MIENKVDFELIKIKNITHIAEWKLQLLIRNKISFRTCAKNKWHQEGCDMTHTHQGMHNK